MQQFSMARLVLVQRYEGSEHLDKPVSERITRHTTTFLPSEALLRRPNIANREYTAALWISARHLIHFLVLTSSNAYKGWVTIKRVSGQYWLSMRE